MSAYMEFLELVLDINLGDHLVPVSVMTLFQPRYIFAQDQYQLQ